MLVGVGRVFESVCLSFCPQYNSKTNDPKVFKLGVGNDLGIVVLYKQYLRSGTVWGSKVKVTWSITLHFELQLC